MPDLQRSLTLHTTMNEPNKRSSSLPPMPVTELSMEQDFRLRQVEELLKHASKEDIIIVFMALQRQSFVLQNNIMNLVKNWNAPTTTEEDLLKSWTSFEINN